MMQSKLARKHDAILYAKGPIFIIAYWDISSHHHRCTEVRTNSTANRQGSYFKTLQIQIALGFLLPLWCWHTEIVAICQLEWLTEDCSGRVRLWLWAAEGKQQDIKKGTTQTIWWCKQTCNTSPYLHPNVRLEYFSNICMHWHITSRYFTNINSGLLGKPQDAYSFKNRGFARDFRKRMSPNQYIPHMSSCYHNCDSWEPNLSCAPLVHEALLRAFIQQLNY